MKNATSPGRDGLWFNTAPAMDRDWCFALTPLGWSFSISPFGRELVVGRTNKKCVFVGPIGDD